MASPCEGSASRWHEWCSGRCCRPNGEPKPAPLWDPHEQCASASLGACNGAQWVLAVHERLVVLAGLPQSAAGLTMNETYLCSRELINESGERAQKGAHAGRCWALHRTARLRTHQVGRAAAPAVRTAQGGVQPHPTRHSIMTSPLLMRAAACPISSHVCARPLSAWLSGDSELDPVCELAYPPRTCANLLVNSLRTLVNRPCILK